MHKVLDGSDTGTADKVESAENGVAVPGWAGDVIGLAAMAGVIAWAIEWAKRLPYEKLYVKWPPLYATYDPVVSAWVLVPCGVAAAGLGLARYAAQVPWRRLLAASVLIAFCWILALNVWRTGAGEFGEPFTTQYDYAASLSEFDGPIDTFARYHELQPGLAVHARAHPPGALVIVEGYAAIASVEHAWVWALVNSAIAASIVAAVAIALRELADETVSRLLLPVLVFAPYALWMDGALDAVFAAAAAWTAVLWLRGRSDAGGLAAGAAFGAMLLLSYGLAPFVVVLAALRRDLRSVGFAAIGAIAVLGIAWLLGFNYLQGVADTRLEYEAGYGGARSNGYWAVGNFAALAIATGPALVLSLRRAIWAFRSRPALVVFAAWIAVIAMTIAGITKSEVERIWLPYMPWLLLCAVAAPANRPARDSDSERHGLRHTKRYGLVLGGVGAAWALTVSALAVTGW